MTSPIDAYRQAASAYTRALGRGGGATDITAGADDGMSGGDASSFAAMVRGALDQTIKQQHDAERQTSNAIAGRGDLTNVVTSVADAEVALQAVVAVRDRVLEAYKDVLRMTI